METPSALSNVKALGDVIRCTLPGVATGIPPAEKATLRVDREEAQDLHAAVQNYRRFLHAKGFINGTGCNGRLAESLHNMEDTLALAVHALTPAQGRTG